MQAETLRTGQHVMAVCNACRYCEQYCPVFPAMELVPVRRSLGEGGTFTEADLNYLANLCHNCGECLYACQYAPPHEFGINVPRTLAQIRLQSYEEYCWPRPLAGAFRHHGIVTALALVAGFVVMMLLAGGAFAPSDGSGNFYAVIPHHVMVQLFGGVSIFVLAAFGMGMRRFWRNLDTGRIRGLTPDTTRIWGLTPVRDVLTLRHLHATGPDCTSAEETRTPWRRWFHHCTFYGFLLCFASTTVAALYHATGSAAPYAYTSLPVILGTVGGLGLLAGPAGLFLLRARRDPALGDPAQGSLDEAFLLLLFLTSLTGLALLALRHQAVMGLLLVVHLATVLALFVTLPYGKFVHGLYRTAALVKFAAEERNDR
jgi:citrate/tricarballylate utilization protein